MGTVSSAISTQAELGSVALESGHSHGSQIWTSHEPPTEKINAPSHVKVFFCYARMVRHDDARRWIFLFIHVVMAPGHPHKNERNFASVTLHVKAEFYCHLFL